MEDSLQVGRAEQDALIRSVASINEVAKRIKVIPELPSEKATDNHPLIKVEFPDEGEVFTYMEGYDYPYRGYPYYEFVDKIDVIKKLSRNIQGGFYHGLKDSWLKWLLIPLVPTLGRSLFWAFAYSFHRVINRFQMRTNRYSQFVRELHRAASVSWSDESSQITDLRKMIRDVECMILEFDNAYRFRAQDILPELDKKNLAKRPIKELNRILDIWIDREVSEDIKNSWRLLKMFVNYYLRFDRSVLRIITRTLLELNIDVCRLTPEDKHFAIPRKDYKFGFMENPTEEDKVQIKKTRLIGDYDDRKNSLKKQSTIEHEIMLKMHQQELSGLAPEDQAKLLPQHQDELKNLDKKFNDKMLQLHKEYLELRNNI